MGGAVLVVLGVLFVPRMIRSANAPGRAAGSYLALLRDGADDAAYAAACSELHQQMSADDFTAALRAEEDQGGHLEKFRITRSQVQIGGNTGIVDFQAQTSRVDLLKMQARMVYENGQWRWCGSRPAPKSVGVTVHFP